MQRLLILLTCVTQLLQAQQTEIAALKNYAPRAIGPASMSGRVTGIAVVDANPNHIYIGTASGGLWKSTSGGLSWVPVFDSMDVGSIGAVAVQQNNTDVVWAGTGEGNPRNSHNSGNGIYKSLNGGRTWKWMGLENTKTIHRIVINPQNPDEVYVAAMGSIWGPNPERGVYKTTDGGKTWVKVLYTNDLSGCAELVMDPNNPNKLFASIWEYRRKPYTFNSGGNGSGFFMTVDGGKTWVKLGEKEGLPSGILGRIGIGISATNSLKVYAMVESKSQELYASENGGYNWKKVSADPHMGNRPFYYSELYVDPLNENHIISLWSQVTHSIDGGKTWKTLLDWNHIHPDHHAFYIHPQNPKLMMNGNDGGFNISYDGGINWRYAANLPVGQFYHVNVDNEVPYHIYGGLQDNGSWKGPGFTFKEGGIRNSDWKELLFGDGFDVLPLPSDHNKGYAAWQGGNAYFYDIISGKSQAIQPVHPQNVYLRFNWNAAMALHPTQNNSLYFGSQFLHKSNNNGLSWSIISPDLTTNDTSKLHQAESGGLTIDATNAENYCTIIAIAPAKSDENVIWVGTDDGNLQLTQDAGKTWTLLTPKISGAPKNAWIPFIYVNPTNAGEAWVVMNNYRQNDWKPYLFKTSNFGKTWTQHANKGDVKGHCLSVLQDPSTPNLVFLGTDQGLWVSLNGGNTWGKWTNNMPSCPVQDLVLQEHEADLVIGTFGRSIYIFDDIECFRMLARGSGPEALKIWHTGHGYLANYQRPEGERFGADAFFEGENKPYGVPVDFYTEGTKHKKTGKLEKTKVVFEIYNGTQKIRTWKQEFDSAGYYRIHWNMRQDGFRFPSHYTAKKEDMLPEGLNVKPGVYRMAISSGKLRDSMPLIVLTDPNNKLNENGETRRRELYEKLRLSVERANNAFEALKEAEKIINSSSGANYENDSAVKQIAKLAEPLKDSIAVLKLLFMQAKDVHYYEDITVRLNDKLYAAYGYIQNNDIPAENADNAIKNAELLTNETLKRVNAFFANQWPEFRNKVESEKIKVFKTMGGY
ncbi:MAG: hypothetical protein IT244_11580 [Bacteroidia bacterium]|nr:hypothetical protein [Bacteroidia bacterium]